MIKSLHYFSMLYLAMCSACSQPSQKHNSVSPQDRLKLIVYENKSRDYQYNYPDSAVYFANQGLKLSRRLHDLHSEGQLLGRMAAINALYGNLPLAMHYQQDAQVIFVKLKDQPAISAGTSCLGILFARQGDQAEGVRLIKEALATYLRQKDISGIIRSYTRLGEVQELANNLPEALSWYEKADAMHAGQPINDDYLNLLGRLGKAHTVLGNHALAAAYYEKGAAKSQADRSLIKTHITMLNNAGRAYGSLGNKAKALDLHRLGLQKARASNLPEEEARSLVGIAGVMKTADPGQSIQHLKNALEIAKGIRNKQLVAEIYRSLSDIYRQQSRYQEALTTLSAHHRLLDSILQKSDRHRIDVLQGSYGLAESKLRIEELEITNQEHIYQRNEGLIAATAILIVLVLIYINYRRTHKLNAALTASNQIKDKLFSIIGHDLRNPIGGITQLLAMMEEGGLSDEESHELITEMRKQGNVTLEILNALLNWGEAQLKGVHVKPQVFSSKDCITKNRTALQQQAADKLLIVIDHTPQELMLYGDLNHFDFVIRNLLSNAIKFSQPSGTVEVVAEVKRAIQQVIISVRDYGKGISPEQQEQFRRAEMDIAYGTNGEKGTGIGLMLSKEFVKANHGRIWLESEPGTGTTFYFSFPLPA